MSGSDPIMQAARSVDAGDDPADALDGDGDDLDGLDLDRDLDEQGDDSGGGFSLFDWASRIPEGSHLDFDARDWWDPETGGETRLAFHLSDASGAEGVGYPNGLGVLVGLAEMYWGLAQEQSGSGGSGGGGSDDSGGSEGSKPSGSGPGGALTVEDVAS